MKTIILSLLKGYKYLISPLTGCHCRFFPTCSDYAIAAIKQYGLCKGIALTTWRLCRCHPGCLGGYDPLP